MNKIILALSAAITFIVGLKDKFKAAVAAVEERDKIIEEQRAENKRLADLLEAENLDDAALEAGIKEAREKQAAAEEAAEARRVELDKLKADIETATAEADKLTAQVSDEPEIPVQVDASGEVTHSLPTPLRGAE